MTLSNSRTLRAIRPLPRAFFARNPRRVARELLGKVLVRDDGKLRLVAASSKLRLISEKMIPRPTPPPATLPALQSCSVRPDTPMFTSSTAIIIALTCRANPRGRPEEFFSAGSILAGIEEMARARDIELHGPRDLPRLTSGPGRLADAGHPEGPRLVREAASYRSDIQEAMRG